MRLKFVMALATVTGLILGAIYLLHQKPVTARAPAPVEVATQPAEKSKPVSQPHMQFAAQPVTPPSAEERQTAIDQQIHQLQIWSQSDDGIGAEKILNEIATNSERKVRLAAIKAVKQTGSREVIPALKDMAERVDDYDEKRALLDAADFLAGPTVSEQLTNPVPQQVAILTP